MRCAIVTFKRINHTVGAAIDVGQLTVSSSNHFSLPSLSHPEHSA
jgi:hypothetical protein